MHTSWTGRQKNDKNPLWVSGLTTAAVNAALPSVLTGTANHGSIVSYKKHWIPIMKERFMPHSSICSYCKIQQCSQKAAL